MLLLIIFILIITIIIFLYKQTNISKKVLTLLIVSIIVIGIIIFLFDKFNIINKIKWDRYNNLPEISQEDKNNSIAIIQFSNYIGMDAGNETTYYIFKSDNNQYQYKKTDCQITIAGAQEEKIVKDGIISNKHELDKIISEFESIIKSNSYDTTLNIIYQNQKVEKEELLNILFP